MMFKQILNYKELVDLSIKKTNLNQTVPAKSLPRIFDLINESDGDELSIITTDCQLFQNDALIPVLEVCAEPCAIEKFKAVLAC